MNIEICIYFNYAVSNLQEQELQSVHSHHALQACLKVEDKPLSYDLRTILYVDLIYFICPNVVRHALPLAT